METAFCGVMAMKTNACALCGGGPLPKAILGLIAGIGGKIKVCKLG